MHGGETPGVSPLEKPAIDIEQCLVPSTMENKPPDVAEHGGGCSANDLILRAADVVGVIEFKDVVIARPLACDVAAVEAVVEAFAEGVLRLAEHRGMFEHQ